MIIAVITVSLKEFAEKEVRRTTHTRFQTRTCQEHASRAFRFEIVLNRRAPKLSQTAEDSRIIERLLDQAEAPLTNAALVEALLDGAHPDPEARRAVEARVRNVMYLLQKTNRAHSLRLGRPVGWVWNHRPLTDEEWRNRASVGEPNPVAPIALGLASMPALGSSPVLH